jgi:hypothetical protein
MPQPSGFVPFHWKHFTPLSSLVISLESPGSCRDATYHCLDHSSLMKELIHTDTYQVWHGVLYDCVEQQ